MNSKCANDESSTMTDALWSIEPGRVELLGKEIGQLGAGNIRVRAIVSGISRGTERTVFEGRVPESEYQRMRCPYQEGEFPFPVKYGYAMVGLTAEGTRVFALHPHQSLFDLPADA